MRLAILLFSLTLTTHAQWDMQDAHTTASLRGIDNVGDGIAWASGTNGTILRTEDGGFVWQLCAIPPGAEKLDFRGIQAFDANTAIAMSSGPGDQSRLYKTTDGCQTWKLLFTNPDKQGFWDAIQFDRPTESRHVNASRTGALVGDPVGGQFVIYTTKDGGDTWEPWVKDDQVDAYKRLGPIHANKNESLFAASNSSLITIERDKLRFVTGGEGGSRLFSAEPHNPFDNETKFRFNILKLPLTSSESSGAFSIAEKQPVRFANDLMIVGGNYKEPNAPSMAVYLPHRVERTIGNWMFLGIEGQRMITSTTPPHGYRSAVAYDAQQKLWITVGPNGTDISRDDGRNWSPLKPSPQDPPDADKNWNALSLPYVVGPKGRIGKLRPINRNDAKVP